MYPYADAIITGIVFFGIYHLIKMFTDFLLKRKIVKLGHLEKAAILDQSSVTREEIRYPTLKWGLVAFMAGLGFIIIETLSKGGGVEWVKSTESFLPLGIELVFISLGFLTYFLIVSLKKR
jgi:hypothetical protein